MPPQSQNPRGILPTYVTSQEIVLCKVSPIVQNTYEIRLALFFAIEGKKTFKLVTPPNTDIENELLQSIVKFGGKVEYHDCKSFSVSVSHFDQNGLEKDSWVLGDEIAWASLLSSCSSAWIKAELKPGAKFGGESLLRFEQEISLEHIQHKNIDNEDLKLALQRIIRECKTHGGYVLIQ
ncbi:hypothetical protein [Herbaspirillum lusitanum]|uniref:hypothetical protein n=1 Tax=Herbaspirillum lusitanum TaxID=213312 RepID=UPI002238E040|nr:hypothetical protein [Herbaspirillum lusitanum]